VERRKGALPFPPSPHAGIRNQSGRRARFHRHGYSVGQTRPEDRQPSLALLKQMLHDAAEWGYLNASPNRFGCRMEAWTGGSVGHGWVTGGARTNAQWSDVYHLWYPSGIRTRCDGGERAREGVGQTPSGSHDYQDSARTGAKRRETTRRPTRALDPLAGVRILLPQPPKSPSVEPSWPFDATKTSFPSIHQVSVTQVDPCFSTKAEAAGRISPEIRCLRLRGSRQ
jgi:hypothetical protein